MYTAEILCLGNELLIGRVINSNATKISLALTKMGFMVTRHTVIKDDPVEIDAELKIIREIRKPNILIVSGGLGLTHDDMQLECIAKNLGRPLVRNDEAENLLKERYKIDKITGVRSKFITLPEGSLPLRNTEGAAPGVITQVDESYWFSVPGVPREMLAILDEILLFLKEKFGNQSMVELGFNAYGMTEPKILPLTEIVKKKYPQFYLKSHPKRDEEGKPWLALHIYGFGSQNVEDLNAACKLWRDLIIEIDGSNPTEIKNIFDENFQSE